AALRVWVRHLTTVLIAGFVIAVAVIGYRRTLDHNEIESVTADDVGIDVADVAVGLYRGFQHTEIVKGEPIFTLNSLKTLSLASGWQEIEGVRLQFFQDGQEGPVLTAEKASFNIETREARLSGAIHVEFPNGAFLNTETGHFNSKRQLFESDAPVLYVDGPTFGRAQRATYSVRQNRIHLEGNAALRAEDGAMLVAPELIYRREDRRVVFPSGVQLTQGLSIMHAPRGIVRLAEQDGPAQTIELDGGVQVTTVVQSTGAQVELWGERIISEKDARSNWQIDATSSGPWVDVRFIGGPDYFERRLQTTRLNAVIGPDGIIAMGTDHNICLTEVPHEGPTRSAQATSARAWFVDGQLTDVELEGDVQLRADDVVGRGHRARLIQSSGIVTFQGDPGGRTRVTLESPQGRVSCAQAVLFDRQQRIEATGQISGEIHNARLLGAEPGGDDAEPIRFAGDRLEVDENGDRYTLSDDARIWQGHRLLLADDVVSRHETQSLQARGHVRATFPADQIDRVADAGDDVVVVARSLDYDETEGHAVFRGAVHYADPKHSLTANRLSIGFDDNDQVTDVEAEGAVEIRDLEMGRTLTGKHAIRDVATQVVTVTGSPAQLTDGRGNVASGESLTWNQADGTVSIGGNTELIYYPEEQP
ncbi:MAG: LptA/OstA family protein, partial [Holophagae bacterium]